MCKTDQQSRETHTTNDCNNDTDIRLRKGTERSVETENVSDVIAMSFCPCK